MVLSSWQNTVLNKCGRKWIRFIVRSRGGSLRPLSGCLATLNWQRDALHDAFNAALEQWPKEGVPANPRAWLVSAGRFKAIDAMRRRARFDESQAALAEPFGAEDIDVATSDDESIEDDRLRLIFICSHPALAPEARVALTLREAIEWGKRCPNPMPGEEAEIEIRQVFEPEDFGPTPHPELR